MRGANSEPRRRPDVPSWRWPFDKASDPARRSTDADAEERRGGVAEESAPDRITPARSIFHAVISITRRLPDRPLISALFAGAGS